MATLTLHHGGVPDEERTEKLRAAIGALEAAGEILPLDDPLRGAAFALALGLRNRLPRWSRQPDTGRPVSHSRATPTSSSPG
jgi:hypothetical protein